MLQFAFVQKCPSATLLHTAPCLPGPVILCLARDLPLQSLCPECDLPYQDNKNLHLCLGLQAPHRTLGLHCTLLASTAIVVHCAGLELVISAGTSAECDQDCSSASVCRVLPLPICGALLAGRATCNTGTGNLSQILCQHVPHQDVHCLHLRQGLQVPLCVVQIQRHTLHLAVLGVSGQLEALAAPLQQLVIVLYSPLVMPLYPGDLEGGV